MEYDVCSIQNMQLLREKNGAVSNETSQNCMLCISGLGFIQIQFTPRDHSEHILLHLCIMNFKVQHQVT